MEISKPRSLDKMSMKKRTAEANETGGYALCVEFCDSFNDHKHKKTRFNWYSITYIFGIS